MICDIGEVTERLENEQSPLLDMATSDTTPRVSTHVLISTSCPSPRRLQRPLLMANATEVLVE